MHFTAFSRAAQSRRASLLRYGLYRRRRRRRRCRISLDGGPSEICATSDKQESFCRDREPRRGSSCRCAPPPSPPPGVLVATGTSNLPLALGLTLKTGR
jgi:hypothetical protein